MELEEESSESRSKREKDRPLLVLLDRNTDLHTMLYHSWIYVNLIQDVYGIKNNQFQHFDETAKQNMTYDIDFQSDDILKENAFKEFGEAAPNVDKSLTSWKTEYERISSSNSSQQQVQDISSNLTSALD